MTLFLTDIWYVCEMYRFITKIIHYFNELQGNNLCIINFKRHNTPSDQLFKEKKILKISGFVKRKMQNLLEMFAKRESIYSIYFHTQNQNHYYTTRAANNYQPDFPPTQTAHYTKNAAKAWKQIERISVPTLLSCEFKDFKKEIPRLCNNKLYS